MCDTEREFEFCFEAGAGKDFEIDPTDGQNRQEVVAASLSRQGAVAVTPRLWDRQVEESRSGWDKFRRLYIAKKMFFSTERTQSSIANKGLNNLTC